MKKNRILACILALAMLLALTACGSGSSEEAAEADSTSTFEWVMSDQNPEGTSLAVFLDEFATALTEASNGRIKITVNHGNSLGAVTDIWEMAKNGAVDIVNLGVGHVGSELPAADVAQLPFICTNSTEAYEVMNGLYQEGLINKEWEEAGLKVLYWMPTDSQLFAYNGAEELRTPDQIAGMKIRAMSGSVVSFVEAMGASAVSIVTTEQYMSLEKGIIDGVITSSGPISVFALYEICDYMCMTPICSGMNFCAVNQASYDELPTDLQKVVDEVAAVYNAKYLDVIYSEECTTVADSVDHGIITYSLTDEELAGMKEATAHIIDEYITNVTAAGYDGQAIVDAANAIIARCENHL